MFNYNFYYKMTDRKLYKISYKIAVIPFMKGINAEAIALTSEWELYDKYAKASLELMLAKNHDYDEAWRSMRISSYTDLILMKIYRTKQIENHDGKTLVSEGVDANYKDMINYALFGLIKLEFGEE